MKRTRARASTELPYVGDNTVSWPRRQTAILPVEVHVLLTVPEVDSVHSACSHTQPHKAGQDHYHKHAQSGHWVLPQSMSWWVRFLLGFHSLALLKSIAWSTGCLLWELLSVQWAQVALTIVARKWGPSVEHLDPSETTFHSSHLLTENMTANAKCLYFLIGCKWWNND